MQLIRTIIAASAFLAANVAQAQTTDAPAFTLDAAMNEALAHNAQLQSMRAKAGAMAERPAQESALPNPMFQYSAMDPADRDNLFNADEKRFMITQNFPWFGKRALRGELAKKDAEAMQSEADAMADEIVMMVKEAYFELQSVQRVAEITRGEEDVLKRMEKSAEAMNASGLRTQQDVLKAQSEITMLKSKLLELEAREAAMKAKLNALLNHDATAPVGRTVTQPSAPATTNTAALLALAEKARPEIIGAQVQIERADTEHRLMSKESFPDYKLGVEYRAIQNDADQLMFVVGVELPIWKKKIHAGVREAAMMRESSRAALESQQRQIASETLAASAALNAARNTLSLYRDELIPQAESAFRASEAAYLTGKADFLDLLESERFLLNARIMAAMADGELGMQAAKLERAVGTNLGNLKPASLGLVRLGRKT